MAAGSGVRGQWAWHTRECAWIVGEGKGESVGVISYCVIKFTLRIKELPVRLERLSSKHTISIVGIISILIYSNL